MKSILRLSLLLLLSVAMFTSCKKAAPKQARHIPKNASFVAVVNAKSIQNKLLKSQATVENLFKSMAGSDSSMNKGKQEWEDFKNSGLDLDGNFFLSVVQKGGGMTGGRSNAVVAAVGGLSDEAKLQAYIKKKKPNAEVKKEKNYSYASMEAGTTVAWGNELVIFLMNERSMAPEMELDSATGSYNFKQPVNAEGDTKAELASYFDMKEDQSVASIAEFRDLVQENADASFWVNSGASADDLPIPLPKLKDLMQNNYTAATINFEDGKIVANSKSYSSQALQDLFKKYSGPAINMDLVERFPSGNINGFMLMAFNPEIINGLINFLEVRAVADKYLQDAMGPGFNSQDLVKAIKGDVAIVVSDFSMPAPGAAPAGQTMKMIVNIPVGDKAQMNKLMDKMVEMQMMVKNGNEYRATEAISRTGFQAVANDQNLIIASDAATLQQYTAGTAKANLNSEVKDGFKGKSVAMYVNIESLLSGVPANTAGIADVMPKAKETFKDFKASSDQFGGKFTEGRFELRLKNEKENSLISLLQFFSSVNEATAKSRAMMPTDVMVDSVAAVPAE